MGVYGQSRRKLCEQQDKCLTAFLTVINCWDRIVSEKEAWKFQANILPVTQSHPGMPDSHCELNRLPGRCPEVRLLLLLYHRAEAQSSEESAISYPEGGKEWKIYWLGAAFLGRLCSCTAHKLSLFKNNTLLVIYECVISAHLAWVWRAHEMC